MPFALQQGGPHAGDTGSPVSPLERRASCVGACCARATGRKVSEWADPQSTERPTPCSSGTCPSEEATPAPGDVSTHRTPAMRPPQPQTTPSGLRERTRQEESVPGLFLLLNSHIKNQRRFQRSNINESCARGDQNPRRWLYRRCGRDLVGSHQMAFPLPNSATSPAQQTPEHGHVPSAGAPQPSWTP